MSCATIATVKCPVCQTAIDFEQTGLEEFEERARSTGCNYGKAWTRNAYNLWACPECLRSGRALPADPTKQDFGGYSPPFQAFWDRTLQCEYCGEPWVFEAEEQRFWYETGGFHVQAYPTGCKPCRRLVRGRKEAQQQLMQLLQELDPLNPDQLTQAGELARRQGNSKRALEWLRRAKNKARDEEQRKALLERIEQVTRTGAPPPLERKFYSRRQNLENLPFSSK